MSTPLIAEIVALARADLVKRLGFQANDKALQLFDLGVEIGATIGIELAKPVVDAFKRETHVGSAWTYNGARGGMTFKTKELAIADALAHGYRESAE